MFWVFAALIVLSGVAVFLRWQGSLRRGGAEGKGRTLAGLRLGDHVRHLGTVYEVVGAVVLNEGGFRWRELKLSDGEQTRWLRMESSGVLRLTLLGEAERIDVDDEPAASLVRGDQTYRLDEHGQAYLTRYGDVDLRSGERVEYYHYLGAEGRRLSIERVGDRALVQRLGQELTGEELLFEPTAGRDDL